MVVHVLHSRLTKWLYFHNVFTVYILFNAVSNNEGRCFILIIIFAILVFIFIIII